MRIYHLSCATLSPRGRRFFTGQGGLYERVHIPCHCLLIESVDGLILLDTGLSLSDLNPENSRVSATHRALLRPVLDPSQSAVRQIEVLGYSAKEVRHVVLTHFDFDHTGGLVDFPEASVHVFEEELTAGLNPSCARERRAYAKDHFSHHPRWKAYQVEGETFQGLNAVTVLSNSDTDVLLVPLAGHTRGHCGVAVREGNRWLLHCGDAYFSHTEIEAMGHVSPGLRLLERYNAFSYQKLLSTQSRLRELNAMSGDKIRMFCTHDPTELERLAREHSTDP
jgi:glyoxylase-like metal-dependent hydrolase (beta-lactamase superfamily II)